MKRVQKTLAIVLLFSFLTEILFPISAYALTSGPSTPEVQSFEPVNTTEMVDLFTGDFTYNIPLMDVDGYPINIAYHGGSSMDQEASWVGLGWNINPGVINRNMRGIPDDFSGDEIEKVETMRDNWTVGVNASAGIEIFSMDVEKIGEVAAAAEEKTDSNGVVPKFSFNPSLAINYNNYIGMGYSMSLGVSLKLPGFSMSLNSSYSPSTGIGYNASASLTTQLEKAKGGETLSSAFSVGTGYNSRSGFNGLTLTAGLKSNVERNGRIKNKDKKLSLNGESAGSMTLAINPLNTYSPVITSPQYACSYSFRGSFGVEAFGANGYLSLGGSYSESGLKNKGVPVKHKAYGYIYSENSNDKNDVILDFNREKDGFFNKTMSFLPLTKFTYDLYSISGHGTAGNYRPFRNDIGTVFDHEVRMENAPSNVSLGIELGAGLWAKFGADATVNMNSSFSGGRAKFKSTKLATFNNKFLFKGARNSGKVENVFFKAQGEPTPIDQQWYNAVEGDKPSYFFNAINLNNGLGLKNVNRRYQREPRRQPLAFFNGYLAQSASSGFSRKLKSYALNNHNYWSKYSLPNQEASYVEFDRFDDTDPKMLKSKHISALVQTKEDGSRYIFDLPVLNKEQIEYSFNISKSQVYEHSNGLRNLERSGMVNYNSDDCSINNKNGRDRRFSKKVIPAYAYSYLLTGIQSYDYIDNEQDGVTPDDFGNAYKFNYTRTSNNYIWRTPYNENMANFNAVNRSDRQDDAGQFTVGSKETWYLHSIEGKSQVAHFYLSERLDGRGSKDMNGGLDLSGNSANQKSYKLDSILLFNKLELINKSNQFSYSNTPIPIKRVYFNYEYGGARNVPNSVIDNFKNPNAGKLRLVGISIANGGTHTGVLTPYRFQYHEIAGLSYSITNYDRWGNLKIQKDQDLSNAEYPYVDQFTSKSYSDNLASEGNLSKITLPSGGEININYESDDYAYVQNKRAMQMYKVAGFAPIDNALNPTFKLYSESNVSFPYVYIEDDPTDDLLLPNDKVKELFDGIDRVYFSMQVDINGSGDYERVNGYALIDKEVVPKIHISNNKHYIVFKLQNVGLGDDSDDDKNTNPITKATWNHGRANLSRYMYKASNPNESGFEQFLFSFVGYFKEMIDIFTGPNQTLLNQLAGQKVRTNLSWVRLNNPHKIKRGGGYRVKKITLSDNWNLMADDPSELATQYGQEYDYTMLEDVSQDKDIIKSRRISSGIASYEPMIGGDENPFRNPVNYTVADNQGAPNVLGYQELPIAESFFPSPIVGYRQVTVKNLNADISISNRGVQLHEFYTSYDFPVIIHHTPVDCDEDDNSNDLATLLAEFFGRAVSKKQLVANQAYSIVTNDMHGKQKAVHQLYLSKDDKLIPVKRTIYEYNSKPFGEIRELSNSVKLVNENGDLTEGIIGEEVDCIIDTRNREDNSSTSKIQLGLDVINALFVPLPIPSSIFSYRHHTDLFESVVATKVIQRYGILKKVLVYDEGSEVETENLVYDSETGEVLLSRLNNEYKDNLYNMKIPAYWVYNELGGVYRNEMIEDKVVINNSSFKSKLPDFTPGDEILYFNSTAFYGKRAWVYSVSYDHNIGEYIVELISRDGDRLPNNAFTSIYLMKSGFANQQTIPIVEYLIRSNTIPSFKSLPTDGIIQSTAREFSQSWERQIVTESATFTLPQTKVLLNEGIINPYMYGLRGKWRPKQEYMFIGNREYGSSTHLRTAGTLKNFKNYLQNQLISSPIQNPYMRSFKIIPNLTANGWIAKSMNTNYSMDGKSLEMKDALGIFQSEYYDYDGKHVVMSAKNASLDQIAYDGFETYSYPTSQLNIPRHLYLNNIITEFLPNSTQKYRAKVYKMAIGSNCLVTNELKHSGNYSLRVSSLGKASYRLIGFDGILNSTNLNGPFSITSLKPSMFKITKGKWFLSLWIKRNIKNVSGYSNTSVNLLVNNFLVGSLIPSGPIINGWQKIEGVCNISTENISSAVLEISNLDANSDLYIDDLRIHPVGAAAKTFAYDPNFQKPVAILDENNFATFYEYSSEGILERVKKETVRGVFTVSETRRANSNK